MSLNFLPCPASVAPDVLAAQAIPPESPLCANPVEVADRMKEYFFKGAEQVTFFPYTREALYLTVLDVFRERHILICVHGPMSQELYEMAQDSGEYVHVFDSAPERGIDMDAFDDAMSERPYEAVFMVETDVFTGTHLNIHEMCAAIRRRQPETLITIDCSGSVFCETFPPMETAADIYICASDMAMGLPPGLGILAADLRAHTRLMTNTSISGFFNYSRQIISRKEKKLCPALPYQLINALDRQIDRVLVEETEQRMIRILRNREILLEWARRLEFEVFAQEDCRAMNVTVLKLPDLFNAETMAEWVRNNGVSIGEGLRELGQTVVISHGNDITEDDIMVMLKVINKFLVEYDTRIMSKTGLLRKK